MFVGFDQANDISPFMDSNITHHVQLILKGPGSSNKKLNTCGVTLSCHQFSTFVLVLVTKHCNWYYNF